MADYISINDLAAILGPDITGDEDFLITRNNVSYKITLKELDAYLRINEVDKLSKSENLNDLENKETARLNLGVYSKEETDENILQSIEDYTVPLGIGTSGDYIKNILAGNGINILNGTGEGSDTTISISNIGTAGTYTKVITNEKGQVVGNELLIPNDIPNLDASKITSGIISAERLPSFVDDVLEFSTYAELPIPGEIEKIYIVITDETQNIQTSTYRWTGSIYALISNNLTAIDIKNLYESNSNTNAFTDALLNKLNGIQTGSQVNTITSVSGKTGNVTLTKNDVGLSNVQNVNTTIANNILSGTLNAERLPNTSVTNGTYGSETKIPSISVDAKGRITDIQEKSVLIPSGNINVTGGDITMSGETGSDITNATLVNTGVTPSTYKSVTVDSKGRVTSGTNPTSLDGFGILDAYTKLEVQRILPAIGLDTTNTVQPTRLGQFKWNQDEATADLALLDGTILQLGQEELRLVRNGTASTILNGTVLMITGSIGNSGRIVVAPHTGLFADASKTYGLATHNIISGADGYCTVSGKVRGINTTGSSVGETWVDGDVLYLKPNDSGKLTKIEPAYGELKVKMARVVHAHSNGTLEIRTTSVLNENAYEPRNNNIQSHISSTANPHNVTKTQVGLNNVENTADINKNVNSAKKLTTARNINDVAFDGTQNIEINSRLGISIISDTITNIGGDGTKETMHILGTSTIESFGISNTGTIRNLIFNNSLIIKSNPNIIFPTNVDILTEEGNIFTFLCEDDTNAIWRCISAIPSRIW